MRPYKCSDCGRTYPAHLERCPTCLDADDRRQHDWARKRRLEREAACEELQALREMGFRDSNLVSGYYEHEPERISIIVELRDVPEILRTIKDQKSTDDLELAVRKALRRADPQRLLAVGAPDDEYKSEASTITKKIRSACSRDEVVSIVHEEFRRCFGEKSAGKREHYQDAADEIWDAWMRS